MWRVRESGIAWTGQHSFRRHPPALHGASEKWMMLAVALLYGTVSCESVPDKVPSLLACEAHEKPTKGYAQFMSEVSMMPLTHHALGWWR